MNIVKKLREKTGKTQEEFAEYCGLSRSSIARYESGEEISRINAEKISKACGVSIGFVLGENADNLDLKTSIQSIQPTIEELELLQNYRKLNEENKESISKHIESLLLLQEKEKVAHSSVG